MSVMKWLYEWAKFIVFWLVVAAFVLVFHAGTSHADTVVQEQLTYASTSTTSGAVIPLGSVVGSTGITTIEGALYVQTFTSSGVNHIRAQIACYDDSARSASTGTCLNGGGSNTWVSASTIFTPTAQGQTVFFSVSSVADRHLGDGAAVPIVVDSSKYYFLVAYDLTGSGTFTVRDAGIAASVPNACVANCGGLGSIYYKVYQDVVVTTSSAGPFTSPVNGDVTSTSIPTLVYSYYNADAYTHAGVRLRDVTALQDIAVTEQSIISNGPGTYSQVAHLQSGDYYQATPYLRDGSSNYIYGTPILFSVVSGGLGLVSVDSPATWAATTTFGAQSNCSWTSSYFDPMGCIGYWVIPDATTTNDIGPAISDVVVNTAPFSWGFKVTNFWNTAESINAEATTSTSTLPTLDVTLPTFLPTQGREVNLTPWGLLLGDNSILSNAENPDTGHTLYQIVYPGWTAFVWLLFVLAASGEIFGWGGKQVSNL